MLCVRLQEGKVHQRFMTERFEHSKDNTDLREKLIKAVSQIPDLLIALLNNFINESEQKDKQEDK